jgi:hypothetical protein
MDNIKDYPSNVLAITDEQVAADWRLGFGRAVAKAVTAGYPGLRIKERSERFGVNIPGGMNEHIEGAPIRVKDADGITISVSREPACPIAEVYNLTESSGQHYEFSTYGDDGGSPVTLISRLGWDPRRRIHRRRNQRRFDLTSDSLIILTRFIRLSLFSSLI